MSDLMIFHDRKEYDATMIQDILVETKCHEITFNPNFPVSRYSLKLRAVFFHIVVKLEQLPYCAF